MTAALYGTTVVNHLEVTGLNKDASGKLCGKLAKIISSQTPRSLRTIVDHCSNDVITLQHGERVNGLTLG
jgi:hypothetical protein